MSHVNALYKRIPHVYSQMPVLFPCAATYDAWNRLMKLDNGSNIITEYEYDSAKRRVIQKYNTTETRHFYYTEPSRWQVIEERRGTSPDAAPADRQHVNGTRYVDDCVLRDRDTNANGSLSERLYASKDGNWNVTGLFSESGTTEQRLCYTAYGTPTFLSPEFNPQTDTVHFESLYSGYRYDRNGETFDVRRRVLVPLLGTWCQRDPLASLIAKGDAYSYCASSPLSVTDPTGMACRINFKCELKKERIVRDELDPCAFDKRVCIYKCTEQSRDLLSGNASDVNCDDVTPNPLEITTSRTHSGGYFGPPNKCVEEFKDAIGYNRKTDQKPCKKMECEKACADKKALGELCGLIPNKAQQKVCEAIFEAGGALCTDYCSVACSTD